MKSTKTVLAVAIVIAGFAYAVGAGHPDTLTHSLKHRCCSPQPEDTRVYHMFLPQNETTIIIPEVEGQSGFVLTDVIATGTPFTVFQDTGEGPVQIFKLVSGSIVSLSTGIPLVADSTITVFTLAGSNDITLIGYVY